MEEEHIAEIHSTEESVNDERRDVALDLMSAVPADKYVEVGLSLVNPKPFTSHTLENIEKATESEVVNSMSVVCARAFDLDTLLNSDIDIHSVDYPLYTGFKAILSAYRDRARNNLLKPKELLKVATNVVGEFLMHADESSGGSGTESLLNKMIDSKKYGILRLDSTSALPNTQATEKIIRGMKDSLQNKNFACAVEIKPNENVESLNTLEGNLQAYEDLKMRLEKISVPLAISLDVQGISKFFKDDQSKAIEIIQNLLLQDQHKIGLLELSGPNHSSPFQDKTSLSSIDISKQIEKSGKEWALQSKKIGLIIETHPLIFNDLLKELTNPTTKEILK